MIPDDHALILFKFGIKKHMSDLKNGKMFLSCAGNYIYIGTHGGNNEQGDKEEGIFARLKNKDSRIEECYKKFGKDLEIINDGDYIKLRRKSSLLYPVFCLYAYKAKDILESNDITKGTYSFEYRFNDKIFDAFTKSKGIRNCLNEDYLPAICVFQPKPFMDNLKCSLFEKGISNYEMRTIDYKIKENDEYYIDPDKRRSELFYKNPEYEYQHETRLCLLDRKFSTIFDNAIIPLFPFENEDCHLIINTEIYFTHMVTIDEK